MMNKIIIIFSTVLLLSCQHNDSKKTVLNQATEISPAGKEAVKKEIAGRIDEIIRGAAALNADSALKPYSNDSSFRIVNPDASVTGYQEMKNSQTAFFNTARSLHFTTVKEDFEFLANDLVMCTWTGYNEFELKTGERYRTAPYVGSMLFKKSGKEWQIIYAHESAGQPVKQQ